MMRRIIENSIGHPLKNQKILEFKDLSCVTCSQGKLIIRPSPVKVRIESFKFLERIQGDICGPIHLPCGPFRYFMVLIDASIRWLHVCLLSTRNLAFTRLLAQIIRLRAQFPDYAIKTIRLDNADLFTARFIDCHFDETTFPTLREEKIQLVKEITWNGSSLSQLNPRTSQCEQEVQRIIHLQNIANQLPDSFTDLKRITKSHILAKNAPIRIDIPIRQIVSAKESNPRLKRGRPIGSKDKNPRKRKGAIIQDGNIVEASAPEEAKDITNQKTLEEVQVPENGDNEEISINYITSGKR
ncbi:hypothetical protein PVK06_028627 [Gossypium arboreum]|uniref:Integrase catalytic domain-containing protein n=1 Tax=Gossypium arboreum TaxID=29729 RepID=A0ABR0P456_GOSAR|nr:hypothetical protein PVK06_028627 [Gossypium arboreum]